MTRTAVLALMVLLAAATFAPPAASADESGDKTASGAGKLLREDTRLIDRRGRVVSYQLDVLGEPTPTPNDRSAFVCVDDGQVFILLENKKLEDLERITRRGEKVVKVSGTLTTYNGKNYLLLTRFQARKTPRREEDW